ncbi:hypothetical protein N7510_002601 [Penicillium lagena]|uniref:uncharacterized protein n=1 Tax=Penicillium lagena TaxID=94218 RepID=UPI00253FC9B3|nr:uncharacterized protein N7510_002601 [Penicillium lagena]KAJ5626292.1 hypothetical protein N7510_002601 [Penicillium lagena]
MNWMGSQLRRHSAVRPGALTRSQRQNLVRSRLKASSTSQVARPPSPFQWESFASREDRDKAKADLRPKSVVNCFEFMEGLAKESVPPSPASKTNHLEGIKRQLLQKCDWATISTACPLNIAFAPVEETERFGKRRRLNDHDKRRLNTHGHGADLRLTHSDQERTKCTLLNVDAGDIHIRINGRSTGLQSSNSQGNNGSSQSMLFDCEESAPPGREKGAIYTNRLSLRSNTRSFQSHKSLPPPPRRAALAQFPDKHLSVQTSQETSDDSDIRNQVAGEQNDATGSRPSTVDRSGSVSSVPRGPRHFTIEDQFLAERMGCSVGLVAQQRPNTAIETRSSQHDQYSPLSPTEAERRGPGWFGKPRNAIERATHPSRRDWRFSRDISPDADTAHVLRASGSQVPGADAIRGGDTSLLRIFGQEVALDGKLTTRKNHERACGPPESPPWRPNAPRRPTVFGQHFSLPSSSPDPLL